MYETPLRLRGRIITVDGAFYERLTKHAPRVTQGRSKGQIVRGWVIARVDYAINAALDHEQAIEANQ